MKGIALLFAWMCLIGAAPPATTPATTPAIRFATVDIQLDPKGQSLAAYQLEVTEPSGNVKLAGIEGGDHPAFKDPPYYDPAALSRNRVILAAFNTRAELPTSPFRAARLHVQISGDLSPQWQVKLIVASAADGSAVPGASATVLEGAAP
jgi:hypothetical protein